MENTYKAETIKTLDYFEHVRQYPGMYIGSKDSKGLLHCCKEIVSNSVDEWMNGAGDTITIVVQDDGGISISDCGRGIPYGEHSKGISVLRACFGVAMTGGKFINGTGEGGYNTSGGEHGTGAKAVNALSSKLIVTSCNSGIEETVEFSRGQFIRTDKKETKRHGLSVLFYPDAEIFETTSVDVDSFREMIRQLSFLCSGLCFEFTAKGKTEKFCSTNGLEDYLHYLNKDKTMLVSPIYLADKDGKYQVEAIVGYNNSYGATYKLYTNNIPQEKGTHLTGFKTAWTSSLNQWARENNIIKEKDENLTGADYEEGLLVILNFKMIDPVFKGQNKEELSSSEGRTYVQKLITAEARRYFDANKKDIKIIIDKALNARKAREAARKARDAARGVGKKKETGLKAKMQLSNKFIDCVSKNPKERSLLLVEGTSAGSSAVEARNPKTDCIYMLRGKIISPLKTAVDKLLANQEMNDIVRVIGAGFADSFDVSKMNFDKIVITADQDSDGADIELLLITFFFTYMRPLVEAGKLYRAVTPLYIIRQKDKEYYAYSDTELEEWKQSHSGSYDLLRAKGLGELNAQDLQKVCFRDERYKRITISDAAKTTELLEILQGAAVPPRKQYIYDNAAKLGFNFV